MRRGEFHGYLVRIRLGRLGNAPVIRMEVVTFANKRLQLYIHNPPDWLSLGIPVEGLFYEAETRSGKVLLVEKVSVSERLKPAEIRPITIEKVERTVEGQTLIEGRRDDGGLFSYLIDDFELPRVIGETPTEAYGIFIERDSLRVLTAVINEREFETARRAHRIVTELAKEADLEPVRGLSNNQGHC